MKKVTVVILEFEIFGLMLEDINNSISIEWLEAILEK